MIIKNVMLRTPCFMALEFTDSKCVFVCSAELATELLEDAQGWAGPSSTSSRKKSRGRGDKSSSKRRQCRPPVPDLLPLYPDISTTSATTQDEPDCLQVVKIVLLGAAGVGKSSIIEVNLILLFSVRIINFKSLNSLNSHFNLFPYFKFINYIMLDKLLFQ